MDRLSPRLSSTPRKPARLQGLQSSQQALPTALLWRSASRKDPREEVPLASRRLRQPVPTRHSHALNLGKELALEHPIATEAASLLLKKGIEAGLSWSEICVSIESTIAIVVTACAQMSGMRDKVAFATEVINSMTENAHLRAVAVLK